MKRSNLIFILLMATLYVIPVLAFSIACLMPTTYFPNYNEHIQIVEIDNQALRPDQVKVEIDTSYLYYEGKGDHTLNLECQDSLLILKGTQTVEEGRDLTLHVGGSQNLKKVVLNGEVIWTK